MNEGALIVLLMLLVILGSFLVLGSIIYYHLSTYSLKQDAGRKAKWLFATGLLLMMLLAALEFLAIDWNRVEMELGETINFNFWRKDYD